MTPRRSETMQKPFFWAETKKGFGKSAQDCFTALFVAINGRLRWLVNSRSPCKWKMMSILKAGTTTKNGLDMHYPKGLERPASAQQCHNMAKALAFFWHTYSESDLRCAAFPGLPRGSDQTKRPFEAELENRD